MSEATKDVREKRIFVLIGECVLSTKKPGCEFYCVTAEQFKDGSVPAGAERRAYSKKSLKGIGSVGSVYEFDADDESIWPGTRRYVGFWPNEADVLRWQCEQAAFRNYQDAKALEGKESKKNLLEECLKPLRDEYHRLPYPYRQALLAAIIYHVTK